MLAVILAAATFQLRFRVDQVTAGNRHLVTRFQTGEYLDLVFDPFSHLYIPRFEHAGRGLHPDHLALAGINDRCHREDDPLDQRHPDDRVDEHVGLQLHAGICHLDAGLDGMGLGIMKRINEADRAMRCHLVFSGRADFHLLADPHIGDFVFEDIDFHPDFGQIGNIEQDVTRIDVLSLLDHFFDNDAGERRVNRQADNWFAGLLQLGYLAFLDPEEHQPLFCRSDQTLTALGDGGNR